MKTTTLAGSGMEISALALGAALFGSVIDDDRAFALMDAYAEAGGTLIDTAHVYAAWLPGGVGASERAVGAWVRARGLAGRVRVATKGAHPDLATMNVPRLNPEAIARDLAESLDRLGLEAVDLYFLHRDDPAVPVGELLGALNEHLRAGRVRALGASNWSAARLREADAWARAHGLAGFAANQPGFSLAAADPAANAAMGMRYMDRETRAWHRESGAAAICYSSQAMGFFSGKYRPGAAPWDDKSAAVLRIYGSAENFARLERAEALARERGATANQIALAWLLAQPFPVVPIVGPGTVGQLRDSLAAGGIRLTEREAEWLENGGAER